MIKHVRGISYGICAAVLSGCYTYVPVERPAPNTAVRITVPVMSAVQNRNQAPGSYTVDGLVVSSGDSLVLETQSRTETGAYRQIMRVDTLRIAQSSLLGIDEKVFSRQKSIGLGVVITAGVVGLISGIISVTSGQDGGGPGGGGTENQIRIDPIFGSFLKLIGH